MQNHLVEMTGHTKPKFYWFRKEGDQVAFLTKDDQEGNWKGPDPSKPEECHVLFVSVPTGELTPIYPTPIDQSKLEDISKMYPWMSHEEIDFWKPFIENQVFNLLSLVHKFVVVFQIILGFFLTC